MVDLTNAPEGSLWINRRGDVMRKGSSDPSYPAAPIFMYFVDCREPRENKTHVGRFVKVFEHNGMSYYGTDRWDIVAPAYTECPY